MGMNFFANFHLTRSRNSLLYHVRQMKKASTINKFYTDENGQIYIRIQDKGTKYKISYFSENRNSIPDTLKNKEEIIKFIATHK